VDPAVLVGVHALCVSALCLRASVSDLTQSVKDAHTSHVPSWDKQTRTASTTLIIFSTVNSRTEQTGSRKVNFHFSLNSLKIPKGTGNLVSVDGVQPVN